MKKHFKYALIVGVLLFIHSVLSWAILLFATHASGFFLSFVPPFLFGILTTLFFLYVFNHDGVIKIAKYLEDKEKNTQRKWSKKLARTGKVVTTILIGLLLGPIMLALAIKLFIPKSRWKYLIIIFVIFFSTLYYMIFLKGAASLFF